MSGDAANFDEMHQADGSIRPAYEDYCAWLDDQDSDLMGRKHHEAETNFRRTGITFNVYGEDEAEERLIPFDMVPRVISASEWRRLSRGIEQRVKALNAFLYDLYHRQEIIRRRAPAGAAVPPERSLAAAYGRLYAAGRGLYAYNRHRSGCAPGRTNSMSWKTMRARRPA